MSILLQEVFKIAGVDTSKGKAKQLIEASYGRPNVITVSYIREDGQVFIKTAASLQQYENLDQLQQYSREEGDFQVSPDEWLGESVEDATARFSGDPSVVKKLKICIGNMKRFIAGRNGGCVQWSVEYDTNITWVDYTDPDVDSIFNEGSGDDIE